MQKLITAAVILFCGVTVAAAAPTVKPAAEANWNPDDAIVAQLATAKAEFARNEFAHVVLALTRAVEPKVFSTLSANAQYDVLWGYAQSLNALRRYAAAHDAFKLLTGLPKATAQDWVFRFKTAKAVADAADAWTAFEKLSTLDSKAVGEMGVDEVSQTDRLFATLPQADKARAALRAAAEENGVRVQPPWEDPSWLGLAWAAASVDRGDLKAAAESAHVVLNPVAIAVLRSDRRFDAIVAADPKAFDLRAAADRWIAMGDAESAKYPNLILAQMLRVQTRIAAGHSEQALAILDEILAKARKSKSLDAGGYEDAATQGSGVLYWKAWLLERAGRTEEGAILDAALVSSTAMDFYEYSAAERLVSMGRGADALKLMEGVGEEDWSLNWRLEFAEVRACAYAQTGDTARMEVELKTLRSGRSYDLRNLIGGLACADRADELAATIIDALANPAERLAALEELQTYAEDARRPYRAVIEARMDTLRARPNVQSAIAKVGRVARWDVIPLGHY